MFLCFADLLATIVPSPQSYNAHHTSEHPSNAVEPTESQAGSSLSHRSTWNRHPGTMACHLGLLHRRQSSRLMVSMCSIPRRRLRRPRCIPAITLAIVLAFCSSALLILGCIPLVAARIIPTTSAGVEDGVEDGASRHNNNWAVLVRFCTRLLVIVLQAVIPQV